MERVARATWTGSHEGSGDRGGCEESNIQAMSLNSVHGLHGWVAALAIILFLLLMVCMRELHDTAPFYQIS